jgi:glycerophosphoryl diester phosphodiesterase
MGGTPENSLATLEYAIERGIDMVHVNPQVTADGRYVLMHDATLNRTTDVETVFPAGPPDGPTRRERGGRDYVRDYTLEQIRRLHLVDGGTPGMSSVPTLEEALDLAKGRVFLMLGLKTYEPDSLAAALLGYESGAYILMDLYIGGTDQSRLRALAERTGARVGLSLYQTRNAAADFDKALAEIGRPLRLVSVSGNRITRELIERASVENVAIAASGWAGVEDRVLVEDGNTGPWQKHLDSGFAALTDQPDLVLRLLGR